MASSWLASKRSRASWATFATCSRVMLIRAHRRQRICRSISLANGLGSAARKAVAPPIGDRALLITGRKLALGFRLALVGQLKGLISDDSFDAPAAQTLGANANGLGAAIFQSNLNPL